MVLPETGHSVYKLTQLGKRCCARIVAIGQGGAQDDMREEDTVLSERRLRQLGFEEDKEIEILHTGPFGRDPLAVRIDRMVLAIRRAEAALITVKVR